MMGADEGYLVSDPKFVGSDVLGLLSLCLRQFGKLGDLILSSAVNRPPTAIPPKWVPSWRNY